MTARDRSHSKEILGLAIPAFLTLVAEPIFLMVDTAVIGHVGTASLAGLGIATAILLTAVNLFVFLAYGTTGAVARQLGAGSRRDAIAIGLDGAWLAVIIGAVVGAIMMVAAEGVCRVFTSDPAVIAQAVTYLHISLIGLPFMLLGLAATGILRGLQDTRTPLAASVTSYVINIVLNILFVVVLGWGIAGSAWGTLITQVVLAGWLVGAVLLGARREAVPLRLRLDGLWSSLRTGVPLLIRTLALRAVLLLTTWAAGGLGTVPLAAHQIATTMWSTLVFALDALGIAGQALTGRYLGAGDVAGARDATATMVRWGAVTGVALAVIVLALQVPIGLVFTGDPAVRAALHWPLVIIALGQPLSGFVFVLDGVLIGAGDGRWLAWAQVAMLLVFLPMVLAVAGLATGAGGLSWLWLAFTGFMVVRGVLLGLRARGDRWLITGAIR